MTNVRASTEADVFTIKVDISDVVKELQEKAERFRIQWEESEWYLGEARESVGRIEKQLDALNERLLTELQRDGSSYLSNARINGHFSLRGCVMNYRTPLRDMEILFSDLRRVAASVNDL